jgi:hypothetical protein
MILANVRDPSAPYLGKRSCIGDIRPNASNQERPSNQETEDRAHFDYSLPSWQFPRAQFVPYHSRMFLFGSADLKKRKRWSSLPAPIHIAVTSVVLVRTSYAAAALGTQINSEGVSQVASRPCW